MENDALDALGDLVFWAYIAPTLVLFFRGRISILFVLCNFLFGWTGIGWFVLFLIACFAPIGVVWDTPLQGWINARDPRMGGTLPHWADFGFWTGKKPNPYIDPADFPEEDSER